MAGDGMTQKDRRLYLIKALLAEQPEYRDMEIPENGQEQKDLLRSLLNVRMPRPAGRDFEEIQDAYLKGETAQKGITNLDDLSPIQDGIYLWQGDITTLRCDAIVNAANSQMLGCFYPCHGCIDNAIHTFSGIQLRAACNRLMQEQGYEEPVGRAKITPAYNLPCKYVLHTVGPVVIGRLTQRHCIQLSDCYWSCLELASKSRLESVAFCCISTGEFHFPQEKAAEIAVKTVKDYLQADTQLEKVVFNVFKQEDYAIYRKLLG